MIDWLIKTFALTAPVELLSVLILLAKLTVLFLVVHVAYRISVRKSASFRHAVLALSLIAFPLLLTSQLLPGWSVSWPPFSQLPSETAIASKTITKQIDPLKKNFSPSDSENPFLKEEIGQLTLAESLLDLPAQTVFATPESTDAASGAWTLERLKPVLIAVWAIGALLLISRLLLACFFVQRSVNRAKPFDDEQYHLLDSPVRLLITQLRDENIRLKVSTSPVQMPLATGFVNKTILLPAKCYDWTVGQWQSVLMHEVAHIKRGDCWTNLVAQLHQAVLWFHPLAWSLTKLIRWECEKACDDYVIHAGVREIDYADVLFRVASQAAVDKNFRLATVSMCETSEVESRMKSILSNSVARKPVSRMTAFAMLIAISISFIGIGTAEVYSANNAKDDPLFDAKLESASQPKELEFTLTLRDDSEIKGASADEITLETAFGEVHFKSNAVRRLNVNDDKSFAIETADGSSLVGQITTESIQVETSRGNVSVNFSDIRSILVIGRAKPVPGKIVNGFAENRVTYHVRAPSDYNPLVPHPAIVILHGSNSNSKNYIDTIVTTWPDIAEDYLLIGINGENKTKKSKPDNPRYNYTYVNFAGKSVYKGFAGTDRESPALVAEVIQEIKANIPISKMFVGGHSQGGFLAYSVMMNFPDLIDGAFPVSGGMIIQCDPFAYEDQDLRKQQREIPLAIVHAPNDSMVGIELAESAYGSFLDDGFPMLRFFNDSDSGHRFAHLPVGFAIRWLESMTTDDSGAAIVTAERMFRNEQYRDLTGLLTHISNMELNEQQRIRVEVIASALNDHVLDRAHEFVDLIEANANNDWIKEFLGFRKQFEHFPAAEKAMSSFYKLRSEQDGLAKELYAKARRLSKTDQEAAFTQLQVIIDHYYASSKYRLAKSWLENRK